MLRPTNKQNNVSICYSSILPIHRTVNGARTLFTHFIPIELTQHKLKRPFHFNYYTRLICILRFFFSLCLNCIEFCVCFAHKHRLHITEHVNHVRTNVVPYTFKQVVTHTYSVVHVVHAEAPVNVRVNFLHIHIHSSSIALSLAILSCIEKTWTHCISCAVLNCTTNRRWNCVMENRA